VRYTVFVAGSIPLQDVVDALGARGFVLRLDASNRYVVDPVPAVVRASAPAESAPSESNVTRMPTRARKAKS
jgi:hypothetical protein